MSNPYGRPDGGFLTDYSGIAAAGSAFEGFAKGFQDAQDHQMKRQEFDAKMKVQSQNQEREKLEQAIKLRTNNLQQNASGGLEDAPPTVKQLNDRDVGIGEKGFMQPEYDETGRIKKLEYNPNSPQMVAAKAKETNSLKPPGTGADKNRDSREKNQASMAWNREFSTKGPMVMRAEGANRILDLMRDAEAGKFKSNSVFLNQINSEIARLETGSQALAEGSQERASMHSSAADLRGVMDKFFNNVSNADLSQQIKQARGMVAGLRDSYLDAADRKAEELMAGESDAKAEVFAAKHKQFQKNFRRGEGILPKGIVPQGMIAPDQEKAPVVDLTKLSREEKIKLLQGQ